MSLCEKCGSTLTGRQRRFCSPDCRNESMVKRERRLCPECGDWYECVPSNPKRACSDYCAGLSRRGQRNPRFNGGLSKWDGRTLIVHRDGTWTFYYRALMEAHLGRELRRDEIVHHINGDPSDDRIENLQVLTRAQHIDVHRAELLAARGITWAAA